MPPLPLRFRRGDKTFGTSLTRENIGHLGFDRRGPLFHGCSEVGETMLQATHIPVPDEIIHKLLQ